MQKQKQYLSKGDINLKGLIIFISIYVLLCIFMSVLENKIEGKNLRITNEIHAESKITQVENKKLVEVKTEAKKEVEKPTIKRYKQYNETDELAQEKQKYVDYVWNKTKNIDMILTFEREGSFDPLTVSAENNDGTRDYGICQLNSQYEMDFISSEAFKDPYKQLDKCIDLYNGWDERGILPYRFFAYPVRYERRNRYYINQEAYNIFWGK